MDLRVTTYGPRSAMAPHHHDQSSFIVVVGGGYEETIGRTEVEHRPGRMILYTAHTVHSQRFGAAGARKIVFTPPASSMEFLRDQGISPATARHVDAPVITHLAQRVLAEADKGDAFATLALEGIELELVAAFARIDQAGSAATPPKWVRRVRDAILESSHLHSLDGLAALCGKHPVHLAREFRRYFGSSVGAYQRHVRLERAREMLRRDVGLTEIALSCGFASHSHFCRAFKEAYGMTPSEFRMRP